MNPKIFSYIVISLLISMVFSVTGQEQDTLSKDFLSHLSLEDLLDLELKIGTVTPTSLNEAPVSVTLIDKEQIVATPARNVLDLIEVYVPGATFTNHWLGSRIGIRGVLGDQNNSYLLMINGHNVNKKTRNGPFYEIQNRDLNDIESIEVIRGPESVTYGHGAIGGIINIKTLPVKTNSFEAGVESNFYYRYGNAFIKGGKSGSKWALSYYAGISRSLGEKAPEYYYIDRAHGYGYGFMGTQWGNKGKGTPAPNFYGDFWDKPQVKAQLNLTYKKTVDLLLRYSDINYIKQQQASQTSEGADLPGLMGKQFMAVAEYKPVSKGNLSFSGETGFISQSNRDVSFYNREAPIDDITNRNYSYAQNELFLDAQLNYDVPDKLNIAIGGNLNYLWLGPEWGMKEHEFINSFPAPLRFVVYDSGKSGFYQKYGEMGIVTEIDEQINAYQFAVFSEIKYIPSRNFSMLFSGRIDKHEFSDIAFSPRIALVSNINKKNTLKFIAQHAVRLASFNELYTFNYYQNSKVNPEVKRGVELMYRYFPSEDLCFDISAFYNSIEQIAWTSAGYSDVVGTLKLVGADFELRYKLGKTDASLNYSYIHQNKWEPVTPVEAYLSNIGPDSVNVDLPDYGINRLNNIPAHNLKLYLNHRFNSGIKLHVNARVAWDYGQNDMLNSFREVHQEYGTPETQNEMENIYDQLSSYGYARPSFTSNISVSFSPRFLPSSEIYIYAMNLVQYNHVRYVYQYLEEGNNRQYPRHVGFINEPASAGIKWIWHVGK